MQLLSGRFLVLGLGVSGRAAAELLIAARDEGSELEVVVVDSRDLETLHEKADELRSRGVDVFLGVDSVSDRFDTCVVSPGIPPTAPLLVSARDHSDECISEIELAYRRSRSPWIAITGTNGKTTVTSLVAHLLRCAVMPAEVLGNIGEPATTVASRANAGTTLVAELSSFQLANTQDFHPRVAVLLNITPDHLDWHGGFEAYARDKARVFERLTTDDFAVIDVDDAGSAPYAERVAQRGVRVIRVSRDRRTPGGAWVEAGHLMVDHNGVVDLGSVDGLRILGDHNISNALAAAAAALAFGADPTAVAEGLASFRPIEHRLEPVAEIDGVEYFNDSKATNPDASIKAITAFPERPLVLLLGGRNKGNDFTSIATAASSRCRTVIAFGESANRIAEDFARAGVEVLIEPRMRTAVARARTCARAGDVVLLSPACASFDEFRDYGHRGDVFKAIVHELESGLSVGSGAV